MNRRRGNRPRHRQVAEIVRAASLLVSCHACGKLHKPENPLDLHHLCSGCTGRYPRTSLEMGSTHSLNNAKIDEEVTRRSPGNYALGYLEDGVFLPFYVGRSDSDLNDRLHSWVGVDSKPGRYGSCAKAAFGSRRRPPTPVGRPALRSVGVVVDSRYTHFRFGYAPSARAAFEHECRNYHDCGGSYGLDNERHPAPPDGEPWNCPVHDDHPR